MNERTFAFALALGAAGTVSAQDMEPRAYSRVPIGMNFAIAGYAYSEGGLATDPAVPLEDAELTTHSAVVAYGRSFGLLGKFDAELALAATIFTDNDDFLGRTREQDPIYAVQGHLVYTFRSGLWLAVDGVYYTGGRTTLDGRRGDDLQENTRVGLTLAVPINKNNSIKLYAGTGVITRTGSDFDTVGIAWQTRWGGGL